MTSPADEPGHCLTTLHDLGHNIPGATNPMRRIGISPDGADAYWGNVTGGYGTALSLSKLDIAADTINPNWVGAGALTLDGSPVTAGSDGTVYFLSSASGHTAIGKVDAAGVTLVDPWVTLTAADAPVGPPLDLTMGRDGNLYVLTTVLGGTTAIFRVTTGGAVTEMTRMRDDVHRPTSVAAGSDGTIWAALDPPPAPNLHTNTTVRQMRPSGLGLLPDDATFAAGVDNWIMGVYSAYGTLSRVTSPAPVVGTGTMEIHVDDSALSAVGAPSLTNDALYYVEPGDALNASLWIRYDSANFSQGQAVLALDVRNPSGMSVLTVYTAGGAYTPLSDTSWTELAVSGTVPADGCTVALTMQLADVPHGLAVGDKYYISAVDANWRRGALSDIPIQPLVDLAADGDSEAKGWIACDNSDDLIVSMLTKQGDAGFGEAQALAGDDLWPGTSVGHWVTTNCGLAVSAASGTVTPTAGATECEIAIPYSAYTIPASGGGEVYAQATITTPASGTTYTFSVFVTDSAGDVPGQTNGSTGGGGSPWGDTFGAGLSLPQGIGMRLKCVRTDGAPFGAGESFVVHLDPSPTGAFDGLWYFPPNPPNLSWFLRVTPAGVATRVASTWDYTGSPPPAATVTNIADGPLGASLACELDQGAGMSPDGTAFYFVDDSDQNAGAKGNLLRVLKLCGGMRWRIGSVGF